MPLIDLGPAPVKKKGLVDLGPAPTPISEALTAIEQPSIPEVRQKVGPPTTRDFPFGGAIPAETGDVGAVGKAGLQYIKEGEPYPGEIRERLKNMITRAISPLAYVMPGVTRRDLTAELDREAEKFTGFGPAVVPAAGKVTEMSAELIAFNKAFGVVHKGVEAVKGVPKVARVLNAIEKSGGVRQFAEKFPRIYKASQGALQAFLEGEIIGTTYGALEGVEEGDILKRMAVRGGAFGGIAAGFSLASSIDNARYIGSLRKALVTHTKSRYSAKIKALPKGMADPKARTLIRQENLELQQIDNIVSATEAQLIGMKSGKLARGAFEAVETPQKAAERIIKYGYKPGKGYTTGQPELKKGMGRPPKRPLMETGKVARAKEYLGEMRQAAKQTVQEVRGVKGVAKIPKPTARIPPVTPEPTPTAIRPVIKAKPTPEAPKVAPVVKKPSVEGKVEKSAARPLMTIEQLEARKKALDKASDYLNQIKEGKSLTKEEQVIWDDYKVIGTKDTAIARIINKRGLKGEIPSDVLDEFEWLMPPVRDLETGKMRDALDFEGENPRTFHIENAWESIEGIEGNIEKLKQQAKPTPTPAAKEPKPKLVDLGPAKEVKAVKKVPKAEIRDLSEKTRKKQIKQTEDAISKHEIYKIELEGIEVAEREIGPGYYYVPKNLKTEVLQVTGKPGQKGFKPKLYKSFTFKSGTSATSWAKAAQIAGLEDIDIDEFVRRLDEAIQARKKIGILNLKALERAIASKDRHFEAMAMKREMLKDGLTSAEINDNIKEQAKYYKMPKEVFADLLVPVERVEYVEKKPEVVAKVAAKGRAVKAKLSPAQVALKRAKEVARKLKRPVYIFQKKGRFTVSKNPPTTPKLVYSKVKPLKAGKLKQEVSQHTVPAKAEVKAEAERPSNIVMVNEVKKRFAEKGLLSKNDKLKNNAKRLAKIFTGKTDLNKMTEEELAKLGPMVDALPVDYRGVAKVPTSTDIITKELADKIGKFKEIGALEKVRPAWRVFEKMGLYKEVFEPAFDAEISSIEELFGFRAEAKQMQKLVGKDKTISRKLFRAIENPGKIKLTSKEAKAVKWGKKYFRDWADRLGLTSEQRRKNYITHIFEREIDQILKEKHPLDPDLIRALDYITPKTVFNPYLQKRLGKKVGLKEDFWAAIEAYENRAIKKFYYEPLIKRVRVYQRFLPPNSARYLRNYITRITKRPLTIDREFNQTLKEVARDISKLPGGKKLAQHLTKGNAAGMLAYNMTGLYYEAWLGLRPASAIKNLSQHGLILAEAGPVAFYKALKTVGTKRAGLLLNSKVLRSRKSGYLPGIDQTYIKNLESKRRKITMAMFRAADRKNVSDAFLAGYHEAKAKGLPDEWAFKRGDEVARKTQWLYSKFAGAEFMQTSPGRVLGVLTTWPENWAELMNDWIRAKPSQVYTDYAKETGKKIPKVNWAKRRKSLWTYLALVSLARLIHKKTPFKALYYTGWTSIKSLVDIASGKLAGLEIPRIIGNLIVGLALADKRRLKQSWNEMKRFVVIGKELSDIITGKKDWINLFIYMEAKKEEKEGVRREHMEREEKMLRPKPIEREKKMLRK